MKNTIRNTVSEVYKATNNDNFVFNKSLMSDNNMSDDHAAILSKKGNELLNKIENSNKNTNKNYNSNRSNNNSNLNYVNRNTTMKQNRITDTKYIMKTAQNGISSTTIIIMFLFVISLIGVIVFFQETILNYFRQIFNDEEKDKVINQLYKDAEKEKERQSKLNDEIKSLKGEINSLMTTSKNTKQGNKEKKKPKPSKDILQQYSGSQILKSDGYCFVGSDNNTRHCVKAYEGEICSSGDVYNRIDQCLVPELRV